MIDEETAAENDIIKAAINCPAGSKLLDLLKQKNGHRQPFDFDQPDCERMLIVKQTERNMILMLENVATLN